MDLDISIGTIKQIKYGYFGQAVTIPLEINLARGNGN